MPLPNRRRLFNENSNPLQRLVGGFVLFLIILMIYSFLKLLVIILGADADNYFPTDPAGQAAYLSSHPLPTANNNPSGLAQNTASHTIPERPDIPKSETDYPVSVMPKGIPKAFVFLDINGNPTKQDSFDENVPKVAEKPGTEQWFVQFGIFRTEASAQRLLEKLKVKDINAEIAKTGNRYVVRTPPNANQAAAEEQLKQFRTLTATKMMLKKSESPPAFPATTPPTPAPVPTPPKNE